MPNKSAKSRRDLDGQDSLGDEISCWALAEGVPGCWLVEVAECSCCDRSFDGITLPQFLVRPEYGPAEVAAVPGAAPVEDENGCCASVDVDVNEAADEAPIALEVDKGSAFLVCSCTTCHRNNEKWRFKMKSTFYFILFIIRFIFGIQSNFVCLTKKVRY